MNIINYGVGNLHSVRKGLEKAGARVEVQAEPDKLRSSDALVLPGVGAFAEAKKNLLKLEETVMEEANKGKPLLGICLGLQLLFTRSYEGGITAGLDLLKGEVVRLPAIAKLPQVGWNNLKIKRSSPIIESVPDNAYVYFIHSYYAKPVDSADVVAKTEYGVEFPSILERKNIFATQFHPEKSGETGLTILRNFVEVARR
ncbi:imidazole glycerol phosphate synthase subunit HisH [Candidatus Bathyarchaeota archaeon]|nr:imidazole glycerol phosphate synthase subunit HisH [Candidatus Bathyarchaeota archaeon]